uniref:Uncharacterized protein n=1 Tax=Plectus sambesii TaxID=2011161 RepID=A0A914UQH8_9BILA
MEEYVKSAEAFNYIYDKAVQERMKREAVTGIVNSKGDCNNNSGRYYGPSTCDGKRKKTKTLTTQWKRARPPPTTYYVQSTNLAENSLQPDYNNQGDIIQPQENVLHDLLTMEEFNFYLRPTTPPPVLQPETYHQLNERDSLVTPAPLSALQDGTSLRPIEIDAPLTQTPPQRIGATPI